MIKTIDELSENHREYNEQEDSGVMMSNGSPLCPVAAFRKYIISRLNPEIASTCFNDQKQEKFVRMKCGMITWFLARSY